MARWATTAPSMKTTAAWMTELGRTARWGTAALVAPLAAAALSAATSWGAAHPPAASGKNSSTDQQSDAAVSAGGAGGQATAALDKSRLALQQQATAEQEAVIRLQKILHRLHARTRALARAPMPGVSGGTSAGGTMPVGGSTSGQGAVAAPPVVAAAPAAPPPTTHGSTGAS